MKNPLHREFRPHYPREPERRPPVAAGLVVFLVLAIMAAFLGATVGHLYSAVRSVVLGWYEVPPE